MLEQVRESRWRPLRLGAEADVDVHRDPPPTGGARVGREQHPQAVGQGESVAARPFWPGLARSGLTLGVDAGDTQLTLTPFGDGRGKCRR